MSKFKKDIIVVAAGPAGLASAISAAEKGVSVIVFEKGATTGGTGNMGMGPLGIESNYTRAKQFRPTRDEAFEIFIDYTHWRVDARLVRAYLNKSADTIHWLEDGDTVELESDRGTKVQGVLKLRKGQHPNMVTIMGTAGHWAKGQPIARGKGVNFMGLLENRWSDLDPVSMSIEPCVKVKIKKIT